MTMCIAAGIGGAVGSMLGHGVGQGFLIVGGFAGGVLAVTGMSYLAARLGWIHRAQRFWTAAGALAGFVLACLVALSTLSSPIGPILSTLLVGVGAIAGAVVGRSAHEKA